MTPETHPKSQQGAGWQKEALRRFVDHRPVTMLEEQKGCSIWWWFCFSALCTSVGSSGSSNLGGAGLCTVLLGPHIHWCLTGSQAIIPVLKVLLQGQGAHPSQRGPSRQDFPKWSPRTPHVGQPCCHFHSHCWKPPMKLWCLLLEDRPSVFEENWLGGKVEESLGWNLWIR